MASPSAGAKRLSKGARTVTQADIGPYLYILRCADNSYYVGTPRTDLETRVAQHNAGAFGG
jgi:hypothetical protein